MDYYLDLSNYSINLLSHAMDATIARLFRMSMSSRFR